MKKKLLGTVFLAVAATLGTLVLGGGVSAAASKDLLQKVQQIPSEDLFRVLEHTDILFFNREDPIPQVSAVASLIDSSPEEVWKVLIDYERYPEWIPNIGKIEAKRADEKTMVVKYKIVFKFSIISLSAKYTLRAVHHPYSGIEARLVEGDVDQIEVYWRLIPVDGGKRTIVLYLTYCNYRSLGWLVDWALRDQPHLEIGMSAAVPTLTIKTLKERLNTLYPREEGSATAPVPLWEEIQKIPNSSWWSLLQNVDVALFSRGPGTPNMGTAAVRISSSPELFWSVITDYENFHELLTNVKKVKVLKREEESAEVQWNIKFKFSVVSMGIKYTSRYSYLPFSAIDGEVISGDVASGRDHWRLIPNQEGNETIFLFYSEADYRSIGRIVKWVLDSQPPLEVSLAVAHPILTAKRLRSRSESLMKESQPAGKGL